MNETTKTTLVLSGLTVLFLSLTISFLTGALDRDRRPNTLVMVDRDIIDNSPVRMNYAALLAADEDTSDYSCMACHRANDPVQLKFDERGKVIVEEHDYIIFDHGHSPSNTHCFNCHDQERMDRLRTPTQILTFEQSTLLCASCHGSTYRDWQRDMHGRTTGFWDASQGEKQRMDCTSCHDPHKPAFPSITPAPAPHSLKGRIILNGDSSDD